MKSIQNTTLILLILLISELYAENYYLAPNSSIFDIKAIYSFLYHNISKQSQLISKLARIKHLPSQKKPRKTFSSFLQIYSQMQLNNNQSVKIGSSGKIQPVPSIYQTPPITVNTLKNNTVTQIKKKDSPQDSVKIDQNKYHAIIQTSEELINWLLNIISKVSSINQAGYFQQTEELLSSIHLILSNNLTSPFFKTEQEQLSLLIALTITDNIKIAINERSLTIQKRNQLQRSSS